MFVRFVGGTSETQNREAEKSILSRYKNRLETNRFNVITDDTINLNLSQTRSMSFEEFIGWVKDQFEEELADHTIIAGEIRMAKLAQDSEGYTASYDINIRAFDRKFMLIKAAKTSSKEITDKLVTYWQKIIKSVYSNQKEVE